MRVFADKRRVKPIWRTKEQLFPRGCVGMVFGTQEPLCHSLLRSSNEFRVLDKASQDLLMKRPTTRFGEAMEVTW